MPTPNARQQVLIARYVRDHPHLAEIAERAEQDSRHYQELGNAIAALPFPPWVDGVDAVEISSIGITTDNES